MALHEETERYILASFEELKTLIRDLCGIPAPSLHEENRARFCKEWFERNGVERVEIDEALNVICPYRDAPDRDLIVFTAHTDTVFPDTRPMPFSEEDGVMRCPGVTDDTANLAVLMICARYIIQNRLPTKTGILFVANAGEEGLGNLKGSRAIVRRYGPRLKALVALDGTNLTDVVARAVGSRRFRVRAATEGGHSFRDFGRRNAIAVLAELVSRLYRAAVPKKNNSQTTYNVGTISGGTSVNTIAQDAELLYEFRSDDRSCLREMQGIFDGILAACAPEDGTLTAELIGERPCAGAVDERAMAELKAHSAAAVREVTGRACTFTSGSTDCNIPLSEGIPSVCLGVCAGGGCHTREEWLDTTSLVNGCRLLMTFFRSYCME